MHIDERAWGWVYQVAAAIALLVALLLPSARSNRAPNLRRRYVALQVITLLGAIRGRKGRDVGLRSGLAPQFGRPRSRAIFWEIPGRRLAGRLPQRRARQAPVCLARAAERLVRVQAHDSRSPSGGSAASCAVAAAACPRHRALRSSIRTASRASPSRRSKPRFTRCSSLASGAGSVAERCAGACSGCTWCCTAYFAPSPSRSGKHRSLSRATQGINCWRCSWSRPGSGLCLRQVPEPALDGTLV